MTIRYAIGLDIGGTKCAVSFLRWDDGGKEGHPSFGDVDFLERIPLSTKEYGGPDAVLDAVEERMRSGMARLGIPRDRLLGIGISCGGPLDSRAGLILSPPNLPGWDRVPIVRRLGEAFGVPVKLQNDANACALAEWIYGAAQGLRNVVFLTFGTGMGAGLILDGRLYSGTNDLAGEVGHIRLAPDGPFGFGKNGSFEGFCSGGGIANLGRRIALEKLLAGETVGFCASLDELAAVTAERIGLAALEVLRISGRRLGEGLSLLIDLLNPEMIVIGSIFGRQYDILWPEAKAVVEAEALSSARSVCRIVPAGLGERVGDYAALAVALYSR